MARFIVTVPLPMPLDPAPDTPAIAHADPTGATLRPTGPTAGRAQQLAERYALRIQQGLAAPGSRLPSVRECARQHGVSPSTVVAAYDQLQARGLVEARSQRGFFVRAPRRHDGGPAQAIPAPRNPPVDATALIRGMFATARDRPGPGSGLLPPDWLDAALLQRALRRACSQGDPGLRYGEPAGDTGLRRQLSLRLADLGIDATPQQIVSTTGATHALDIVARAWLQPGDAVLIDEPGWAVEFARLSALGMRLLPVPRGPQGPDLAVMAQLAAVHRPKLYVTVSVLHNPTGCSLPLATAHQVLRLAEAQDFAIVEDDTYAWMAPNHAPRLAALDGLRRSIYVSGFSKILAPNWRVGYLAAPAPWVDRLIDAKMISSLTTPALTEQAVAWCLEQGLLRRHAERVLDRLDRARSRTLRLAEQAGCHPVTPPQGLFGWMDTGLDTDRLAEALLDQGWLLAPGSLFLATRRPSPCMRINFATSQDPGFWRDFESARVALQR